MTIGDQLDIRLMGSNHRQLYHYLNYSLPVSPWYTRLGASYSDMEYELGKQLKDLDAHGTSRAYSIYVSQPWWRGPLFSLSSQLMYEEKRLHDDMDMIESRSKKNLGMWTFSTTATLQDRLLAGAISQVSLSYSRGQLSIDDPYYRLIDRLTARTHGNFSKANLTALRLQQLSSRFSLYGQLQTQWSNGNLDSAEKMSLGGPYAVRAYANGVVSGDQGAIGSLELRYDFHPGWRASLFTDYGGVQINRNTWSKNESNSQKLGAYGIGLQFNSRYQQELSVQMAWPMGPGYDYPNNNESPRIWFNLVQRF